MKNVVTDCGASPLASPALNGAAFAQALSVGGLVVVPAGCYYVAADAVAVGNLDGLRIQGEARESTTLRFVGAGKGLSFTNVGFLTLKDMTLEGDGSDQQGVYGNGIKSSEIERLMIRGVANHAIHLCGVGALDVAIDRVRIAGPSAKMSGARALKMDGGNAHCVSRCYFNGYEDLIESTADSLTLTANIYENATRGLIISADFVELHAKHYSMSGDRTVIGGNYNATIISPRNCVVSQVNHAAMNQKKWLHFLGAEAQGSAVWTQSAP